MNVSEGRDERVLSELAASCGNDLLDLHRDPHHHRAVLTLVGEEAPRHLARAVVARIDVREHSGVHPRLGSLDVVPFVALAGSTMDEAIAARDSFAQWAADELSLPCFLYGPERTLPEVRREAWHSLQPDVGPATPHHRAGACCVGARDVLVAYNVWLAAPDGALARRVARAVRGPYVRALGLDVGGRAQVSMNLLAPDEVSPDDAYDRIGELAPTAGAELVGLVPERVLQRIPATRWHELDLSEDRTIEARLAQR